MQFIFKEFKGQIILITDAGFCSTWFNKVRSIGWDYKGRKKPLNKQRYPQEEKQYKQMYKAPWLLISSLDNEEASKVIALYALRMQIEQNFRDIKNSQYGFGLEESGTKDVMRLNNLLLIATIAIFIAFILGLCAEQSNLHKTYQANTIKNRRVLSLVSLGKRVWKTGIDKIAFFLQKTIDYFINWHGRLIQND